MNKNTPFAENGSVAIFGKWYWNDVRVRPDLFAIVSWGMPGFTGVKAGPEHIGSPLQG
jgi:hypothetical protein